jgi:glycosyltransferase involved in cell wall biosynthesis
MVVSRLPGVVAVENSEARGLSGARNSGVSASRGDIVAFMDDDARADPDWLGWIEAGYLNPNVLGVGGAIRPAWDETRPGWFPDEFDWVVGCTYRGMPETAAFVRNLIGANMSFTREALAAGGPFRSGIGRIGTLPVGCEETELCIRIGKRIPTGRFYYDPRAVVRHRVPAERALWRYFVRRCYAEGRSKALVAQFVGARSGLATESRYTARVLPAGVGRYAWDALGQARPVELLRSGAIVLGLGATLSGYLHGRMTARRQAGELEVQPAQITDWPVQAPATDRAALRR